MKDIKSWTGERLETYVYSNTAVEHLHRYAMAIELVKDKKVLDIACGEGYGTHLISRYAKKIIGVDIDENVIKDAKAKYKIANLEFKVGRVEALPIEDNSVDVVISFETLEHHEKHVEMLLEIKRVLSVNGIIIISTPDKKYYSDIPNYKNPFHIKELYGAEFRELVKSHFKYTQFYLQNIFKGSLILPNNSIKKINFFEGDFHKIDEGVEFVPMYHIAVASDELLNFKDNISFFNEVLIANKESEILISNIEKKVKAEMINSIKNSWTFRIGSIILSPLKFFKKISTFL